MADETQPTKKANPAPLGLLGFGMTTVLLSLHNAEVLPLDGFTLAMGVFVGGLAQILAGIMEYRNGNTFGTVAFTLYGMFWMTFVATHAGIAGMETHPETAGTWLLLWGILTLFLFMGTLKGRKSLMFVFATLTITFFLLSAGNYAGIDGILMAGGAVGGSRLRTGRHVHRVRGGPGGTAREGDTPVLRTTNALRGTLLFFSFYSRASRIRKRFD